MGKWKPGETTEARLNQLRDSLLADFSRSGGSDTWGEQGISLTKGEVYDIVGLALKEKSRVEADR